MDATAEQIQSLGGVSLAMAPDVAETTRLARPLADAKRVPVQLCLGCLMHTRSLFAAAVALHLACLRVGDDGTNDLIAARYCALMNCRPGSSANNWSMSPLVEAEGNKGHKSLPRA